MPIRWRTDIDKHVVVANFERRGWEQCSSLDDDFDVYWASVGTVKQIFGPGGDGLRLQGGQLINHYPNHYELTRKVTLLRVLFLLGWWRRWGRAATVAAHERVCGPRPAQDLMVKNLKRYQKQVKRDTGGSAAAMDDLDIIPATFVLPQVHAAGPAACPPHRRPQQRWPRQAHEAALQCVSARRAGLRAVCGGVSAHAVRHVDHEAQQQEPGQGHLPHQQAQPGALEDKMEGGDASAGSQWCPRPTREGGLAACPCCAQVKKWSGGTNMMPPALRNSQESYVVRVCVRVCWGKGSKGARRCCVLSTPRATPGVLVRLAGCLR